MIPESLRDREKAAEVVGREYVGRRAAPHLRCGWCNEPFDHGERGVYVDDERCHAECAAEIAP